MFVHSCTHSENNVRNEIPMSLQVVQAQSVCVSVCMCVCVTNMVYRLFT